MSRESAAIGERVINLAPDAFAEAREKLYPRLRNRSLAAAADALADGQAAIAEPLVAGVLKAKPADPDALNLMADIARRSKRFEQAEQLLSQCVALSPACAGYRYNFAVILRLLHENERALAQLDKLLANDPENPLFRDQKATILSGFGRNAEALAWRRELAEEYSECPEIWLRYGYTLRDEGFLDRCVSAFHKALDLAPDLTAAYAGLAGLKVYRFTAAEIERMEALLGSAGLSPDWRADLHLALGTAYEKQKLYAKSFDNFSKSNALRCLGLSFDPEKLIAHRTQCESLFTKAFFHERAGWGFHSEAPIFIVGMPRSGSTLIEQILCSHTAVEGLGELADFDVGFVRPFIGARKGGRSDEAGNGDMIDPSKRMNTYLRSLERLDAGHFRSAGEEYLVTAGRRRMTGRPFFTDKTLSNYAYIGLIHLILPRAKVIDVRRHPLDCGWSCFKSRFAGASQPFSYRLGDIGRHYANYINLMTHFDHVLPGNVYHLLYETLVADPKTELMRLFDYLQLPFEDECLRFHENTRAVATLSSQQVRQPLYRSGVAQWVPFEPWLGPLKSALGPVLDSYANAPDGSSDSP